MDCAFDLDRSLKVAVNAQPLRTMLMWISKAAGYALLLPVTLLLLVVIVIPEAWGLWASFQNVRLEIAGRIRWACELCGAPDRSAAPGRIAAQSRLRRRFPWA